MKKTMVFIFIFALLLSALTGCGSRRDDREDQSIPRPDVTASPEPVVPEDDEGMVEDENGIIGDHDKPDSTDTDVLPQIGQDVEQGVDDVIDDVGDAVEGSDSNAGANARGRR